MNTRIEKFADLPIGQEFFENVFCPQNLLTKSSEKTASSICRGVPVELAFSDCEDVLLAS